MDLTVFTTRRCGQPACATAGPRTEVACLVWCKRRDLSRLTKKGRKAPGFSPGDGRPSIRVAMVLKDLHCLSETLPINCREFFENRRRAFWGIKPPPAKTLK